MSFWISAQMIFCCATALGQFSRKKRHQKRHHSCSVHFLRIARNARLLQTHCIRVCLNPYQDQKVVQIVSDPLSWLGLKCNYCVLAETSTSKQTKRCIMESTRTDSEMLCKWKERGRALFTESSVTIQVLVLHSSTETCFPSPNVPN